MELDDHALSTYAESSILQRSLQHEELLITLADLCHAPTAYQEGLTRLSTLQDCLATHQMLLDTVKKEALAKRRKLENGQQLSAKKAFLRATKGKTRTVEHVKETEHNLIEALRREREEQMIVQLMETEIDSVTSKIPTLQSRAKQHETVQQQLDALYEDVFAGPTPEFPEEDDAELDVIALEKLQKEHETVLSDAQKALNLILEAGSRAIYAYKALEQVKMSPYQSSLVPRVTETLHKESLRQSKIHTDAVSAFYKEACLLDKQTTDKVHLPPINNFIRKYRSCQSVQDNDSWTQKLHAAVDLLKEAALILHKEQYQSQRRIAQYGNVLKETRKRLNTARKVLDSTRRTIFLDVVRSRCGTATPPSLVHTPFGSPTREGSHDFSSPWDSQHGGHFVRDTLMEVLHEELGEALPDYLPRCDYFDIAEQENLF